MWKTSWTLTMWQCCVFCDNAMCSIQIEALMFFQKQINKFKISPCFMNNTLDTLIVYEMVPWKFHPINKNYMKEESLESKVLLVKYSAADILKRFTVKWKFKIAILTTNKTSLLQLLIKNIIQFDKIMYALLFGSIWTTGGTDPNAGAGKHSLLQIQEHSSKLK